MKISELIEKLKQLGIEHGDIPVITRSPKGKVQEPTLYFCSFMEFLPSPETLYGPRIEIS